MPIYEYELDGFDCGICSGRFEALQGMTDDPLKHCPSCGLPCRKVVSRAQVKVQRAAIDPDSAAKKGLSTFKKSGDGIWEKLGGPGVDAIVGTEEDKRAVKEKPAPVLDLDAQES